MKGNAAIIKFSHNSNTYKQRMLPNGCAAARDSAGLGQHVKAPEQAQKDASPINRIVTSRSLVGDISVVTLIRTGTLDHCQNAKQAR